MHARSILHNCNDRYCKCMISQQLCIYACKQKNQGKNIIQSLGLTSCRCIIYEIMILS